jgi:hypothetical protein
MTYIPSLDDDRIPPVNWMPLILNIMAYPDIAKKDLMKLFRKESASILKVLTESGAEEALLPMLKDDSEMILAMMRVASESSTYYDNIENRAHEGILAGEILLNIFRLDAYKFEGSIAKAVYLIEKSKSISRSKLMRAWGKYKNVSNYHGAMFGLINIGIYNPIERFDNAKSLGLHVEASTYAIHIMFFQAFINIAMWLGKMANEKIDKRTKKPLIELSNSWTVKQDFIERARAHCRNFGFTDEQILQINVLPCLKFTQKELDILSKYKAGPR